MRHSSSGGGFLVLIAVLLAISYYGEQWAKRFASEVMAMVAALAPIWVPVGIAALALLLFRYYWSRW